MKLLHALLAAGWLCLPQTDPDHVPCLMSQLKAGDESSRRKAVDALAKIGPPAIPALIFALGRHLGDPEGYVARGAAEALKQIGPAARRELPALLKRLVSPSGVGNLD